MKKRNNKGFVLLETLIATVFIASALIFFFVQFNSLNRSYEKSNIYNKVEDLYALNNIASYIKDDNDLYNRIKTTNDYIDLTSCEYFTYPSYCKKLFELENIDVLIAVPNNFNKEVLLDFDDDFIDFVDKIKPTGKEKYRLIAKFKYKTTEEINNNNEDVYDYSFATIRFGEKNE